MTTVADMIDRFAALDTTEAIRETMAELKPEIADAQRGQMLASKKADGSPILPLYSPKYAKQKGFQEPNLKLTGAFQDNIIVDVKTDIFQIDSTDDKSTKLKSKYGEDIFGLTDTSLDAIREIGMPVLIDKIKEKLLL
jgi:hypothetical protein